MTGRRLVPALLLACLLAGWLIALTVVFRDVERTTATQVRRTDASDRLLSAMLDRESSVRGYLSSANEQFRTAFTASNQRFDDLMRVELDTTSEPELRDALLRQQRAEQAWERLADEDVREFQPDPRPFVLNVRERARELDAFRHANAAYRDALEAERERATDALLLRAIVSVLGITLVAGGAAWALLRRGTRRARRDALAQAEFAQAMQSAVDEPEADALLKRHLERQLDGAVVTVLRRNASEDRLEAGTPAPPDSRLAETLAGARPRDCLAIRRSATHLRGDATPLVDCQVCGRSGPSSCRPLLVGDRIIGSVLVEHEPGRGARRAAARDERMIADSLAQAAPILSGLRTLALAQARAMTDALTGLPNRWALQDALKRMLAQSARSDRPLALVMLDLDHFKQLNDAHGHDAGDQALAAVGHALTSVLRGSDLAARSGGEEFSVLLPETPLEGALAVAEQLRTAIATIELPVPGVRLTASFGVAVLGVHAADADALARVADRALYAAKRAGRNRVEIADAPASALPERV